MRAYFQLLRRALSSGQRFFALRAKKELFTRFLLILSAFWYLVVNSVTLSSNLSKFEKIPKKIPKIPPQKIKKKKLKSHKFVKTQKNPKISTTKNQKNPKIQKNLQKSKTINFFFKKSNFFENILFLADLKTIKMLSSQFFHLRRLVFDQSSPVHPFSESRGGYHERYGGGARSTEILCLILDGVVLSQSDFPLNILIYCICIYSKELFTSSYDPRDFSSSLSKCGQVWGS